jgi:glutathione S-transferase
MRIYHLTEPETWRLSSAAGSYTTSSRGLDLAEVGFIHCALAEQVDGVHDRYYADVDGPLVILAIDTDLLTSPWRLDEVPGQPLPFPHVYGPLDLDAIVSAKPYVRGSASS